MQFLPSVNKKIVQVCLANGIDQNGMIN